MKCNATAALLPVLLLGAGCGGGGRQASAPPTRSGPVRFDVDVGTGKVTIGDSGRALFEGGAVSFTSSDLLSVGGDAGQRVLRVKATNASGQPWGASSVKLVIAELANSDAADTRIKVRVGTRAGSGTRATVDGYRTAASFAGPSAVEAGVGPGSGSSFVTEFNGHTLRTMTADGMVSTLAGQAGVGGTQDATGATARFFGPAGAACDGAGNLFVADQGSHRIRRVTHLGQVTTIAGDGTSGVVDGPAQTARFSSPTGIAVSVTGDRVYVSDRQGYTLRMVRYLGSGLRDRASSYEVTTVAGTAGTAGFVDGTGTAARFRELRGLELIEGAGSIEVLLATDHTNRAIRRIDAPASGAARVTTIAGTGTTGLVDGPGSSALMVGPSGLEAVALEGGGFVAFVADTTALRSVTHVPGSEPGQAGNYIVRTVAGATGAGYANGDGYAARFGELVDVAVVGTGHESVTLLGADYASDRIREIVVPSSVIHSGGAGGAATEDVSLLNWNARESTDPIWSRAMDSVEDAYETELQFYVPSGVSGFSFSAWIETDTTIMNLPAVGQCAVTTLAGNGVPGGSDGPGAMARLDMPVGVAAVPADLAWHFVRQSHSVIRAVFTDRHRVRYIDRSGVVGTLAGFEVAGSADGMSGAASFNRPHGIAVAPDGSLVVADRDNHRIRRIWPSGLVATIAGSTSGSADGSGSVATFSSPEGVAVSPGGVIYVADTANHTIRRMVMRQGADPRLPASYEVKTVAGLAGASGLTDGAGTAARLNRPMQIVVADGGQLRVADMGNNRIRLLSDATSITMSVSTATVAVTAPSGVAVDPAGHIYVAESTGDTISRLTLSSTRDVLMSGHGFTDGRQGAVSTPMHVALEESGTLLFVDQGNHALRSLQRVVDQEQGYEGAGRGRAASR